MDEIFLRRVIEQKRDTEFERFCHRVFNAYFNNYMETDQFKDKGIEGHIEDEGIYFQMWSPTRHRNGTAMRKKINDDLLKLEKFCEENSDKLTMQQVSVWQFVTNIDVNTDNAFERDLFRDWKAKYPSVTFKLIALGRLKDFVARIEFANESHRKYVIGNEADEHQNELVQMVKEDSYFSKYQGEDFLTKIRARYNGEVDQGMVLRDFWINRIALLPDDFWFEAHLHGDRRDTTLIITKDLLLTFFQNSIAVRKKDDNSDADFFIDRYVWYIKNLTDMNMILREKPTNYPIVEVW